MELTRQDIEMIISALDDKYAGKGALIGRADRAEYKKLVTRLHAKRQELSDSEGKV